MLRNESYKKGMPKIVKLDHTHVFHSINSQMKPQDTTSTVGGHFHKIRYEMGADGTPKIVEVGPPMTYKYVTRAGGVQKRICVQVGWDDETGDESRKVLDTHTHDFEYIHSEELSENKGGRSVVAAASVLSNPQIDLAGSEGFSD